MLGIAVIADAIAIDSFHITACDSIKSFLVCSVHIIGQTGKEDNYLKE